MNSVKGSLLGTFVAGLIILIYVLDVIDILWEDDIPTVDMNPYFFEKKNYRIISSCLNADVFATTSFAFASVYDFKYDNPEDWSKWSTTNPFKKLGMSMRRFTNLDHLLLVPVSEKQFYNVKSPVHKIYWDQYRNLEWKVCFVPRVNHFSKLTVWGLIEYEGVTILDSSTFCVSNPSLLFTYHLPNMIKQNMSLGANIEVKSCAHKNTELNDAVLLIRPCKTEYERLLQRTKGNYVLESDFLNAEYGTSFYRLPYVFNANVMTKQCDLKLWETERANIVFYHFAAINPTDVLQCVKWRITPECNQWKSFNPPSHTPYVQSHHNVTVVTAFYDIGRDDRAFYHYLPWLPKIFLVNYPMIVYCHPDHKLLVKSLRKNRPTLVITTDSFPLQNYTLQIAQIIQKQNYRNKLGFRATGRTPEWNTPAYIPIQFSKFEWLRRSIALNPFNSNYFYWMDAGMGRFYAESVIGAPKLYVFDKVLDDKVTVSIFDSTWPPVRPIIGTRITSIAGTMFGGRKDSVYKLCNHGLDFFHNNLIKAGKADNEQVFLGIMYWRQPKFFNVLYPTDFPGEEHCNFICV